MIFELVIANMSSFLHSDKDSQNILMSGVLVGVIVLTHEDGLGTLDIFTEEELKVNFIY